MSGGKDISCGCPPLPHPPPPLIPAGLSALAPRQWAGYCEYREALLAALPLQPALLGWRARGEADLGVMLLESWAYVLDVVGFYDARSAERAYLQTAPDEVSARRLTELIGHRPRPAMAARVQLALEADGHDPLLLPIGTGFRSGPFDGEPPQVFELVAAHTIWPQRNRFEIAPIREGSFDGVLRFGERRAPAAGALLCVSDGTSHAALRVRAVVPERADDGALYQRVVTDAAGATALSGLIGLPLSSLEVSILRLPMAESALGSATGTPPAGSSVVLLDALYPQLRAGQLALVQLGSVLHAVSITSSVRRSFSIGTAPATATVVATEVQFTPELSWTASDDFLLHGSPFEIGAPTRPAKTALELADLQPNAPLKAPVAPLVDAPMSGEMIAEGAARAGALLPAALQPQGAGLALLAPDSNATEFAQPLLTPVKVYGNVVEAVRGERVGDEVLGSGDASKSSLSLKLKKKPLGWIEDASHPLGRRPQLTVRVDGQPWTWVDSLFGHAPDERIYRLRQDAKGETWVEFGFGRGALPPTGRDNIRAEYRFGAGAAKPPAGGIDQIAVPVRHLKSVRSPLAAHGGADAEGPDELRERAPASALSLGRAVSLADFEAMARGYAGVVNAASAWSWDEQRQRAGVSLWVISDGGDLSTDLRNFLAARALPGLSISVVPAVPAAIGSVQIALCIESGFAADAVLEAARLALFDEDTGFLAAARQRIGIALFRSELSAVLHAVAGVAGVSSIHIDGVAMAEAISPGEGGWFDLEAITHLSVGP
jgi:predicted phage baseplate assembly protein